MIPYFPGSKVGHVVEESTGCWIWQGAVAWNGYGIAGVRGTHKTRTAHRIYYERIHGPVPAGLDLDHLCRNRRCVNPEHLEPVTRTVNARRGSRNKVTEIQAEEIRRRYAAGGISQRQLGTEYGIDHAYISQVVNRKRRRDDVDGVAERIAGGLEPKR